MPETNEGRRKAVSMRFTPEALRLLDVMAQDLGINRTSVVELAIREKARRDGYKDGGDETSPTGTAK